MSRASWAWLLLLCVAGCESPLAQYGKAVDELEKRASFDLNCPREQIEWTSLGERTRGATGCGRQASYLWVCQRANDKYGRDIGRYDDDSCQWLIQGQASR